MRGVKSVNCCQDRGPEGGISKDLNTKVGKGYRESEMSLRLSTNEACEAFGLKGEFANLEAECLLRGRTGIEGCMS